MMTENNNQQQIVDALVALAKCFPNAMNVFVEAARKEIGLDVFIDLVKEVEFVGDEFFCPWCYGIEYAGGHKEDCKRQVALFGVDWNKPKYKQEDFMPFVEQ